MHNICLFVSSRGHYLIDFSLPTTLLLSVKQNLFYEILLIFLTKKSPPFCDVLCIFFYLSLSLIGNHNLHFPLD